MYNAVKNNNISSIKELLKNSSINVNKGIKNIEDYDVVFEETPLYYAIKHNYIEAVNLLLSHSSINVNLDNNYETPLYLAVNMENTEAVKVLVNHPDININHGGSHIDSPLALALKKKNLEIIGLILSHPNIKIDENIDDIIKITHKLCTNNDAKTLQVIFNKKTSNLDYIMTKRNKNSKNAIEICIDNESYDALKILMVYGKQVFQDKFSSLLPPRRVIILGDEGCGKTTFKTLCEQYYSKYNKSNSKTSLLKFGRKSLNFIDFDSATDGIDISNIGGIDFWEFGGQEIFYSTHQLFISPDVQYIILIDLKNLFEPPEIIKLDQITPEQTMKQTKYWLNIIKEYTNSPTAPPIIIIGTHCDLLSNNTPKYYFTKIKDILKSVGYDINRINSIRFMAISKKKNVYTDIHTVFSFIDNQTKDTIIKYRLDFDKDTLVFYYAFLKQKIDEKKHTNNSNTKYIWWNEYLEICKSIGLHTEKDIVKVTDVLVNFGIILTFKNKTSNTIPIVILDPEWFAQAFKAIISLEYQGHKEKKGFIRKTKMEKRWKRKNIPETLWNPMKNLFTMFNIIYNINNENCFVPHMLYSKKFKHVNEYDTYDKKIEYIKNEYSNKYKNNLTDITSYERVFQYSDIIPHGFLDRIVIRILNFPITFEIDEIFIWKNQFILYSDYYWILICCGDCSSNDEGNEIRIRLFVIDNDYDLCIDGSFFHNYIFNSPTKVLKNKYFASSCYQEISKIYYNNTEITNEGDIINNIINNKKDKKDLINQCPDLSLRGIEYINLKKTIIIKKLYAGILGVVWLAKYNNEDNNLIVVKEHSYRNPRNFFTKVITMQKLESCKYLIQFKGIGYVTTKLLNSSNKVIEEEKPAKTRLNLQKDNDPLNRTVSINMAKNGLLMVFEYAKHGNLKNNLDILKEKSLILKLKIALDIIKGINELHLNGVQYIHRDITSQNILILSLNEAKIDNKDYIHAKIGDFGTLVVGAPTYHQEIEAWQYMPPEVFKCDLQLGYNQSIDIYSFAILLWEIIECKPLYENNINAHEIKPKIIQGERLPIPDNIPDNIKQLLILSWHQDPTKRPSPKQIISTLEKEIYS